MRMPLSELDPRFAQLPSRMIRDDFSIIREDYARQYSSRWLVRNPWFIGLLIISLLVVDTAMIAGWVFSVPIAGPNIGIPFIFLSSYACYLTFLQAFRMDVEWQGCSFAEYDHTMIPLPMLEAILQVIQATSTEEAKFTIWILLCKPKSDIAFVSMEWRGEEYHFGSWKGAGENQLEKELQRAVARGTAEQAT